MPPVLEPEKSKVDGLAFIGLSLSRASILGHPGSITHQDAFDLNEVMDRDYEFIYSTDDNGWLAGGGEPGAPKSYKLAAKDSSHVELMRIGTYNPAWGGVSEDEIVKVLKSGKILIPQIEVVPTAVVASWHNPPELEIRFDMIPSKPDFENGELPVNWALRFIHNQLFHHFKFPSRFCPGAFHSTITRKAEFRSKEAEKNYFEQCDEAVRKWRVKGPQSLNSGSALENEGVDRYTSGIWLFRDRENITNFFPPNFLPPYDTPEKREIINKYLKDEWCEKDMKFKPVTEVKHKTMNEADDVPVSSPFCCMMLQ